YQLHRDLLKLRHEDSVFRAQGAHGFDGAVLAPKIFILRIFGSEEEGDRLLVINLDVDYIYDPAPEPLLAPPEKSQWQIIWSSEGPVYGGRGTTPFGRQTWKIPGYAAIVLASISG
ncbi:MAG: DUF3459 domain-containing protein, partial [Candidatus Binatia bacterium]